MSPLGAWTPFQRRLPLLTNGSRRKPLAACLARKAATFLTYAGLLLTSSIFEIYERVSNDKREDTNLKGPSKSLMNSRNFV